MRKLFVLGDSISIHYGPYLKKAVKGKFEYDRKRGIDQALTDLDTPQGANGGDSRQVLEYLTDQDSKGVKYDILLLNCGLHDIRRSENRDSRQVEADEYRSNLERICDLACKMSEKVLWVESTPVADDIHNTLSKSMKRYNRDLLEYNKIAKSVMAGSGIQIIPLYSYANSLGENAYCDHIHFNESTREKQAEFISVHLEELCLK